jgi:hypothetical protein
VNITNNGTAAVPMRYVREDCIAVGASGAATLVSTITDNVISAQSQTAGDSGVQGVADAFTYGDNTVLNTAALTAYVNNNNVSQTKGNGIELEARSSGTVTSTVNNNTVATPTELGYNGIHLVSGTVAAGDSRMCVGISGNSTSGSGVPGIGLRKFGTGATINDFGIGGLTPSPATAAQTNTYVVAFNPASVAGVQVYGGGDNFTSCNPVA